MTLRHILSADQFDIDLLTQLYDRAEWMREKYYDNDGGRDSLRRKFSRRDAVLFFYEPSSRTYLSFSMAASKLGLIPHAVINAKDFSSASKGETSTDTQRVLNEYDPDVVIIRHHITGAVAQMAEVSRVPIINAGDGKGEHPTQYLLDTYTIYRKFKKLSGMKIVIGGDLARGRTAKSLARGLSKFEGNEFVFVSTPELMMDEEVKQILDERGVRYQEYTDMNPGVFADASIVYWTRAQNERPKEKDGEKASVIDPALLTKFSITPDVMNWMPNHSILMHPLPIDRDKSKTKGEIVEDVYQDSRCMIFNQSGNGLWIRMALLEYVLNGA